MTAALTPSLALAYLRELSADIRAAIVLDAAGSPLAGPQELAAPARALLADGAPVSASTTAGAAFGARDERHAIVVVTGPFALPRLVFHDLARVLTALGGPAQGDAPIAAPIAASSGAPIAAPSPASSGAPIAAPTAAAEALLSAVR